jgi:hypothetical protein
MRVVAIGSAVVAAGWIATACVGSDPDVSGVAPGDRGGACKNGVCLAGLACVDKVCVLVDAGPSEPLQDAASSSEVSSDASHDPSGDASNDAGDAGGCANSGGVVISEILSRGVGGPSDEYVELYNLGANVILDSSWTLYFRGKDATGYSLRWTGSGKALPKHGHYLIGGSGFTAVEVDGSLTPGIGDSGSLFLEKDGVPVDAVCYSPNADAFSASFTCEGTPISFSPHDDTSTTNNDQSLERLPRATGSSKVNCQDTGQNANDFVVSTENPQSLTAP